MEGAVMCRWLVDPNADSTMRIQRAVALLLDDYRNRRAWENDRGIGDADFGKGKNAAQRHEDLRQARDDAKIEAVPVLKYTKLFSLYAGYRKPSSGSAMYRLLSAWAHGLQWQLATANLVPIEDGPNVPGGGVGRFSANDEMTAVYTSLAVRLTNTAFHELMAYRGLTL
jgi:hypothetical protein